jgi:two-component system sensor kinase FixL
MLSMFKKDKKYTTWLSIKNKFMIAFIVISLIPGILIGLIVYRHTSKNIAFTKLNDLMNIVDAKYIHLLDFLETQKIFVDSLARNEYLHEALESHYHSLKDGWNIKARSDITMDFINRYLTKLASKSKLAEHIMKKEKKKGTSLKKVFGREVKWDLYSLDEDIYRYKEIFFMDVNGRVAASSNKEHIGSDMSGTDLFSKGRQGVFVQKVFKDMFDEEVFGFSAPIIKEGHSTESGKVNGKLLGVMAVKVGTKFLTDLVTGDLGNRIGGKLFFAGYTPSTDFYLIDEEGYMMTQSKVLKGMKDSVLKQEAKTLPWSRCVDESFTVREAQEFYPNYAGTEVGGASMCIFDLQWTIVGEQNKNEIMALSSELFVLIMSVFAVISALTALLSIYLSKRISTPIRKLFDATKEIEKGNYDVKVDIESNDETGMLAKAFNEMIHVGKVSKENLEQSKNELEGLNTQLEDRVRELAEAKAGAINMMEDAEVARIKAVSAEEGLRESEERFRSVAQTANDAIISADACGCIIYWNKGARTIFGYLEDEIVGKPITTIMPERFREDHQKGINNATLTGENKLIGNTIELTGLRKDGAEFPLELSLAAWNIGEKVFYTGIIRDITERKLAENRLEQTLVELKRSNDELQQFAYVASHDLQEPLRKIRTFGDRLKVRCGEALSEQGQDYLARMQNAAGRMQTLIEDLLMFSRVATQARPFVSVDLAQVAREVVADLEARIEEVGGEVEVGALPTLEADPVQMRQLLQNLLGNALKFHRLEVPPRVTIEAYRLQPGEQEWAGESADRTWYQLTVRDNGIGFDDKYSDRIFTVFQRLNGRSAYEGTGVGLAVCRKIAERHGGRITAQSTPGEGATFVATLPGIAPQETIVP